MATVTESNTQSILVVRRWTSLRYRRKDKREIVREKEGRLGNQTAVITLFIEQEKIITAATTKPSFLLDTLWKAH